MNKQIQSQINQINQFMGLKKGDAGYFVLSSSKPGNKRIYKLARCTGNAETYISESLYASEMKTYLTGIIQGYVLAAAHLTKVGVPKVALTKVIY